MIDSKATPAAMGYLKGYSGVLRHNLLKVVIQVKANPVNYKADMDALHNEVMNLIRSMCFSMLFF